MKKNAVILAAGIAGIAFFMSPKMTEARGIPDEYYMTKGQKQEFIAFNVKDMELHGRSVQILSSTDQRAGAKIEGVSSGESKVVLKLLGMPVKNISVHVQEPRLIIPGGQSIGVALHTDGALVVGTSEVISPGGGKSSPARDAGITAGTLIKAVNGVDIRDSAHLSELVNGIEGDTQLTVINDGIQRNVTLTPCLDASDKKLRLGLWVRDSTAGVGTLTFYDPDSGGYGALGHAITDVDTRDMLTVRDGEIYQSNIVDIVAGTRGQPGELRGSFGNSEAIGTIERNTQYGIFGNAYQSLENAWYSNGVPVGRRESVHTGKAELLTTIDSSGVKRFECEIVRLQNQTSATQRGMVVQITDNRLLKETGGIIQGMSGSPILQDGKLIGALTHVLVNDPSKGYGMFIEWMLENTAEQSADMPINR